MKYKAFTLIELLIIIAIIGILAAFIVTNLSSSQELANDSKRKTDIANLYTSILSHGTATSSYPAVVSNIKEGETNSELATYIGSMLKTTPYDPITTSPYFYLSDSKDFAVGAVLSDGTCFC